MEILIEIVLGLASALMPWAVVFLVIFGAFQGSGMVQFLSVSVIVMGVCWYASYNYIKDYAKK